MQTIKVGPYIFECSNDTEAWRAQGLMTKEEGTIRWLEALRPDDVVYDIGANIGLYTIVAASKLTTGKVYAFEPHVGSAARCLRNIRLNRMTDRAQVFSVALHNDTGFFPFNYAKSEPGSTGSQLNHTRLESGKHFEPVAVEMKYAVRADTLPIESASVVKIDVDGNEDLILQGFGRFLKEERLRTVQVEMHPVTDAVIQERMAEAGFVLTERHYTASGKKAIANGAAPESVFHNAIFTRG